MDSTIAICCTVLGAVLALAGWLSGRDKKNSDQSEWKGSVNTKLDTLITLCSQFTVITDRLGKVEESSKSAHKRIDRIDEIIDKKGA